MLDHFLHDDSTEMRLLRSVVQGLVSVAIVAVPVAIGAWVTDPVTSSLVTAAIMCFLSPLMAMMRTGDPEDGTVDATGDGEGE